MFESLKIVMYGHFDNQGKLLKNGVKPTNALDAVRLHDEDMGVYYEIFLEEPPIDNSFLVGMAIDKIGHNIKGHICDVFKNSESIFVAFYFDGKEKGVETDFRIQVYSGEFSQHPK